VSGDEIFVGVAVEAASPETPTAESAESSSVEAERDDYLDQLRRLAAEFDNYKKRVAREHAEIRERANERLIGELLPVYDDLERALEAFGDGRGGDAIAEGVALVQRSLWGVLEREGVVVIDPIDEAFDPHRHEALLSQPSDQQEGTVLEVVQRGYALGERVLRPARVIVAGGGS
jgi:molecular chaperone GrpE